ncbi:GGDEF domain-containing protein [Anaeromyxobacter oryzae]|uniref:diguanylate cyclase n=1 Tax=Anaeromyxobacter oryzae TaxID=2918170 RepID=A0ABM7WU85_9BACT|nr:GGDEF domain-containing protein [Anaeromyxobacter oryzae]BDG03029.1 GGDEF domain-containing protein [Anaeromyxobacter oryzae]
MPNDEIERTWTAVPRLTPPDRRHAFFLVLAGPQFGEIFPLEPGRELLVGRREDADIPIRDDGISRRHAAIRVEGEGAVIRDLGSVNGTWVDGVRVEAAPLVDGSRVAIGGATTLKFAYTDELEARWQLKLAESALQDPLTGLSNRRHLEERLAAEVAAGLRHARPVSVLLVDVDHFKAVNDAHGHLAGDEALKMVAFVLRGAVRKEDVLARFGGEEFVVVARETPLAGARALGERIRRAVERSRCAWQGQDLALTVSIGVTVSVGAAQLEPGRTERELLESADRALYLAKQGGRNRVVAIPAAPSAR